MSAPPLSSVSALSNIVQLAADGGKYTEPHRAQNIRHMWNILKGASSTCTEEYELQSCSPEIELASSKRGGGEEGDSDS